MLTMNPGLMPTPHPRTGAPSREFVVAIEGIRTSAKVSEKLRRLMADEALIRSARMRDAVEASSAVAVAKELGITKASVYASLNRLK